MRVAKLTSPQDALSSLEQAIKNGLGVNEFLLLMEEVRKVANASLGDLEKKRKASGAWKKYSDELVPLAEYVRRAGIGSGTILSSLDSERPDAFIQIGNAKHGVEVTQTLGYERKLIADRLNKHGESKGFIGCASNDKNVHQRAYQKSPAMYSTETVLDVTETEIRKRLSEKSDAIFSGMILLISVNLVALPRQHWLSLPAALSADLAVSPFRSVVALCDAEHTEPIVLKGTLKL